MIKRTVRYVLKKNGYQLKKIDSQKIYPTGASQQEIDTLKLVQDFTMNPPLRTFSLIKIVKHIIERNIPGDFIECGVWRGGSSMAIAKTLFDLGVKDRKIFLYDTFEGMTQAGRLDFDIDTGEHYHEILNKIDFNLDSHIWAYAPLSDVEKNMSKIKLASDQVIFVKGDVKDTLSRKLPINIALLRLDTDFYESTKLELEILYPLVSSGGAVLVDDYGAWAGSQIATDEYRRINNINSYLNIIDNESRLFFKP